MALLSLSNLSHFHLEDIFDEGTKCKDKSVPGQERSGDPEEDDHELQAGVSIISLVAGSETLRKLLLKLKTDSIYCALEKSCLGLFLPSASIRSLAQGGKEIEISRTGAEVYSSRKSKTCAWYALISGKLKVRIDELSDNEMDATDSPHFELHPGEVFGGYGISPGSTETVHVIFEAMEQCKYIELSDVQLKRFVDHHPELAAPLLARLGGDL